MIISSFADDRMPVFGIKPSTLNFWFEAAAATAVKITSGDHILIATSQ
jgi:hypothetical protein